MTSYIVVEDSSGEWWEGALVEDVRARMLESKGVILLPVIPSLTKRSGVGGFHLRKWGSGWELDSQVPRIACPMTMYCEQPYNRLNWVAKVLPSSEWLEKLDKGIPELLNGFIKICADSNQSLVYKPSLTPVEDYLVRSLTRNQLVDGAFILKGTARIGLPADSHYGFGLYAVASGLRVVWSAISQSHG